MNAPSVEPPAGLSPDALDLFEDVTAAHGTDLAAERFGALIQACRMVTLADRAEASLGDDFTVPGYKGQPTPNGLLSEIRLGRAAAVTALKAFGLTPQTSASAAGAALAFRRHHKGRR